LFPGEAAMKHGYSLRGLLLVAISALPLAAAEARPVRVDFDAPDFSTRGSDWLFNSTTLYGPSALPGTGSLLFSYGGFSSTSLNVGGSLFTGFCVFEDGAFSLTQAGGSCGDAGNATFNAMPIDVTARDADQFSESGTIFSTIGYAADNLDPGEVGSGAPYDINDSVSALRFTWQEMAGGYVDSNSPDGTSYSLQAYIYFLGNGDFDLDLRYGTDDANDLFPALTRSFTLGGTTLFSSSDAIVEGGDYFYRFRNGVLTPGGGGGPPTGVPEPSTWALMLVGVLMLAWSRRRELRPLI
jgi:hypothetical protein